LAGALLGSGENCMPNCRPDKPDDHLCSAQAEAPVAMAAMQRHFSVFYEFNSDQVSSIYAGCYACYCLLKRNLKSNEPV